MAVAAEQRCFRSEEESISLSPPYRAKSRGRGGNTYSALATALLSLLPSHPPLMETNIAAGIREIDEFSPQSSLDSTTVSSY